MEDYFFWEDAQKLDYCKRFLGGLIPILGGQIHTDTDDEKMELRTQLGSRPARVVIDYSSGWVETQTKITNTFGVLVLHWDPEKQPKHQVDAWDEDKELRYFIGPGVYIEEYPDEAGQMVQLVGRLPPQLVQEYLAAMPGRFNRICVDADKIEIGFKPEVHEIQNPGQLIPLVFGMLDRTAQVFESGSEAVAAKPRVYIGGKPVGSLGPVSCPYCRTLCDLSQGSHCPNCGSPVTAPG